MTSELTGVSVSRDVSRQSSDSDISTTQQGWHDDLMTAMLAEGLTHSRRTVTHITPLRDRIKSIAANSRRRNDYGGTFTPATVTASTSPTIFDYSAAHFDREGDSAEQPTLANRPIDQEYTSSAGKKTWGEAVYKVGYEREVLDTEARLHETMHDIFGSHICAKLEKAPGRVLDIGTGLGLWPIAQSKSWPNTRFIGLDRAPCQLDLGILKRRWKMGNVSWIQADFLEPLPFRDKYFGYIHLRFIGLGVPEHKWPLLLEECYRILEPGGKIEIVECSYDLPLAPSSVRNSFASLLLADLVAESPAQAINFTLPMLSGIKPSSIHPVYSEIFTSPPGALQDAASVWISSSLDYKVSCRLNGGTLSMVRQEMRGSEPLERMGEQPVRLWVWVIEKLSSTAKRQDSPTRDVSTQ